MVQPARRGQRPDDCNAEKMRVCRYVGSDDEPTPPEQSAAIDYGCEVDEAEDEPRRLYPPIEGARTPEYEGRHYFVRTGEQRQVSGEFYLHEDHAVYAYMGLDNADVCVPTEPRHGDEIVTDAGSVLLDCPAFDEDRPWGPRWINARGRSHAGFERA